MKTKIRWSCVALAVILTNALFAGAAVTLMVYNPRGEITPPPLSAPSARLADPSGKRIAIYWNGKEGGDNFWNNIEILLKEKIPNIIVLRYNGPFDLGDVQAAKIAREADAFFYGVGD